MINVTCAIIPKDNKILVSQRSETMKLPLKCELPGGKVEENESEENCLLREIKEELNLDILIIKRLEAKRFDYETFSINRIPFISQYLTGKLILAEHKAVKWLSKEELFPLDWVPADIPVLKEFLKYKL